jgi:hypothetical protein
VNLQLSVVFDKAQLNLDAITQTRTNLRRSLFFEDSPRVEGHPVLIAQRLEEVEEDGEPLPVTPREILAHLIQCARQLIADPTNWYKPETKLHRDGLISCVARQPVIIQRDAWPGHYLRKYRGAAFVPSLPPTFHLPASSIQRSRFDNP